MDYKAMPSQSITNMSGGLPEGLQGLKDINGETICRSTDFVVRHLITPAVEATVYAFMRNCTPESQHIIPDHWSLCTPADEFNCEDLHTYTSQCKAIQDSCTYTTTTAKPGAMEMLMDDTSGVLILVGLVLLGVLLGAASTIAVCLMCPQTHRWANSKLRNTAECEKKARESVVSDYYTAIDDRHNHVTLQLRPVKREIPDSPDFPNTLNHPSGPRDVEDSTLLDSGVYSCSRSQMPPYEASTSQASSNGQSETYEPLSRHNPHNQSHKYADIDGLRSPTSPNSEHAYFVLEKSVQEKSVQEKST